MRESGSVETGKRYRWDVAKLVRHGILIPAFVGSSPTVPAMIDIGCNTTRGGDIR